MPYLPHTAEDRNEMLEAIGVEEIEDLFEDIPEALRLKRALRLRPRATEAEILEEFEQLAAKNVRLDRRPSFLGAGVYRRFIPSAIDYLSGRGEFNTAYTPYQPEVSQGTLQAIFEYQTLICRLTAMEISNASLYEGATALVEAVVMCLAARGGTRRLLLSEGIHPEYLRTLRTYFENQDVELVTIPLEDGVTPPDGVRQAVGEDAALVAFQNPNFFGFLEDGKAIRSATAVHGQERAFLVAVVDPISLGLLSRPGDYEADVAVGDGQQLGNYPSYGGPTCGFFATREAHVRKVPGRVVGETTDRDGRRGYVLTFQTREQHIRRERATSNICTNQGLCSLRAAMYLALLGEQGLREVAAASVRKAHYAAGELTAIDGVEPVAQAPFFNEFPLRLPLDAEEAYRLLGASGIGGGLPLGRYFPGREQEMLVACTELTRKSDIDRLAGSLRQICGNADRKNPQERRHPTLKTEH